MVKLRGHPAVSEVSAQSLRSRSGMAVRQAAAEGLTLERSDNATGFRGVKRNGRRFAAQISNGSGGNTYLGTFDTAEEAALAFARAKAAAAPEEVDLEAAAAEAVRQAAAEGLTLERSDNATGFRGVYSNVASWQRRFVARIRDDNGKTHLGTFDTAEEAALAFARAEPEAEEEEEFEAVEVEGFTFRAAAFVNAAADGTLHEEDAPPAGKRQRLAAAAALTPRPTEARLQAEGHAAPRQLTWPQRC